MRPSDVFYDLGCGDASVLIYAVRKFGVKEAVGFENDPTRNSMAKQRVTDAGMGCEISIRKDMQDADLNRADVILSMLPESGDDYDELFKNEVRPGTRLIKHDLPLLGFDYTDVDYPFYLIRFPLRRIKSPLDWASRVIGRRVGSLQELWHELFYYQEKGYTKWDIRQFERVLLLRQEAFSKARHKTEVRIAPTFTRG